MEEVSNYICGLKPSIQEEMLEEVRHMPFIVCSDLIHREFIAAAKRRFWGGWMKHTQPRQLMNISASKKGLPTILLNDTSNAPFSKSTLPNHLSDTTAVVLNSI